MSEKMSATTSQRVDRRPHKVSAEPDARVFGVKASEDADMVLES